MVPEYVDELAAHYLKTGRAPGISIAYGHRTEPILARGYGVGDARANDVCTPETTFCIGSITKQFTAAAILDVAEARGVDIDEDVAGFFETPSLPRRGVSLRHLLSHTGGLSASAERAFCSGEPLAARPEEVLRSPNDTEPGVSWRYCNVGFAIATRVLEQISGETYRNRLSRTLFELAHLKRTSIGPPPIGHVARGHARTPEGFGYVSRVPYLAAFGSGDIYSTARDLVRWFKALAAGQVISSELYELMRTPFILRSGETTNYGLGMFVSQFGANRELSQDGNSGGFSSQLASYPDQELFVAILSNSSAHDAEGLEKSITRSILLIPDQVILDLAVPTSELNAYSGEYTAGAEPVRVWAESGALFVSKPSGRVDRLLNQGSGVFVEGDTQDVKIRFGADAAIVSRNGKTLAVLERRPS